MSSDKLKVLLLGESSTISYLTWALSIAKWEPTVITMNEKRSYLQYQPWFMFVQSKAYDYHPKQLANDLSDLHRAEDRLEVFDIVISTYESYLHLESEPQLLHNCTDNNTLWLIDATENIWITEKFSQLLPGSLVLSICSDIDCRLLKGRSNCFRLMSDSQTIMIGSVTCQSNNLVIKSLNCKGVLGVKLSQFSSIFQSNQHLCQMFILPADYHKKLSKVIWKNLIRVVCFEALSIIFEEPDILSLAKLNNAVPLMKGTFQEILSISKKLKIKGLPFPFTDDSKKLLQTTILSEGNRKIKRLAKCSNDKDIFPKFIEANKSFYDFSQGIKISIPTLLLKLLQVSDEFNIDTPFLESTYSVINRFVAIRDGIDSHGNSCPSRLFQVKKNESDLMAFETVNGIPPNKNMMNFPPFNPLPIPNPPTQYIFNSNTLVFMSQIHSKLKAGIEDDEDDDNSSIDSALKELMIGRENITYSDEFYDAETHIDNGVSDMRKRYAMSQNQHVSSPSTTAGAVSGNLDIHAISKMPASHLNANKAAGQQQYFNSTKYQQPNNPNAYPDQDYAYGMSNIPAKNYIAYQNYNQYARYSQESLPGQPLNIHGPPLINPRKRPPFFRASAPTTRKTSSQKLRQSHANLLEMIHFDSLMDKTTSNRYGVDYDTSSTALNTANSRGSRDSSRASSKSYSSQIQPAAQMYVNQPAMDTQMGYSHSLDSVQGRTPESTQSLGNITTHNQLGSDLPTNRSTTDSEQQSTFAQSNASDNYQESE